MSKTVLRALDVITAVVQEGPLTATEVAKRSDVSLSTSTRLMQTLEHDGFVRRDATGRYGVGPGLLALAHRVIETIDVRQIAAHALHKLNDETGQTVHLGYFDGDSLVYIDRVDGTGVVRMRSQVGRVAPLHCTAMGKATAAFLPEDKRYALAHRISYTVYTPNTITSATAYLQALDEVRRRGYALNIGEHESVISAVAVPLRQPDGSVTHAIDLAVVNALFDENALQNFIPHVIQAAHEIESLLGYRD